MKNIFYLTSICLAFSMSACEDFLSVESPDKLTTGNYWRNEEDAQAGLAAAYSQLYHGDTYATSEVRWPTEEYRSDIVSLGSDAGNYDQWVALYYFNYTNGNTQFSYYYQDLYRGINFANQVLANVPAIPGLTEDKRNELMNEAHFLRGYYHMMLLLNWERIIIRDEYIKESSQVNRPLSDRADGWNFVIDELEQFAVNLPEKRIDSELGRATRGAAYAYLGFAYLTRAYEEPTKREEYLGKSLSALDNVKGYELVSGEHLIGMFNGTNKNCKESVFEIQYSKSEANGSVHYSFLNQWIGAKELGGYDEILPSTRLMNEYKKEGLLNSGRYDERLYHTIYFKCDYFNDGTGRVMGKEYNDLFAVKNQQGQVIAVNDKPVFRRFTSPTLQEMQESCAINIPLMRYVNVLLMKAEVLNEQGHPEQAIPIINTIRRVHGNMPPMKGTTEEEVAAQIEHERILEFPLECYRWYDLRRWGRTASAMQAAGRGGFDDSKLFYPVPKWELDANPEVK